jgi:potassium-transporting ATPase potassium-binding subunit
MEGYFLALFMTSIISIIFVILVLSLQNYLPSSQHVDGLSIDLAFHTAMSFITNTDLQHYVGENQLSVVSQMVALTFAMFVAPAFGIVTAFAFIRSFIRKNFGLGNFYVDFVRVIITLLLPVAFISSLLLIRYLLIQFFCIDLTCMYYLLVCTQSIFLNLQFLFVMLVVYSWNRVSSIRI